MMCIYFSLDLPQEPPAVIESNRVPAYWPSNSNSQELLRVENLEVKYAPDLPAVLKNVSFSLQPGERVGLLGRTGMCLDLMVYSHSPTNVLHAGSGKSTLAMSILRFVNILRFLAISESIIMFSFFSGRSHRWTYCHRWN